MSLVYRSPNWMLLFGIGIALVTLGCNASSSNNALQVPGEETDSSTPAATPGSSGGIAEAIQGQTDSPQVRSDYADLPDDINQLMSALARKQNEQTQTEDPQAQYQIQQFRLAATRKLLENEISEPQREEFVKIQLDALLRLIRLGDPQAQHDYRKLIKAFSGDKNPNLRQAMGLASLLQDYSQLAGQPGANLQPIVDAATSMAEEFPDSFEVCKQLGDLVGLMLQQDQREMAKRLSWALSDAYQDSASEPARNYVSRLDSRVRVASTNLDLIVKGIRDGDTAALQQYQEALSFLFANENLDLAALDTIMASLYWLEQTGQHDQVLQANDVVSSSSAEIQNHQLRSQVLKNCARRETRLAYPGKPFAIRAVDGNGQDFDWSSFAKGQPVVAVFWSPSEPASVRLLQQLSELNEFQGPPAAVKLLAVSLSSAGAGTPVLSDSTLQPQVVYGPDTESHSTSEFLDEFGAERLPTIYLVDRAGIVVAVNPAPNKLRTSIARLIEP